jgi:hypothetical protein
MSTSTKVRLDRFRAMVEPLAFPGVGFPVSLIFPV